MPSKSPADVVASVNAAGRHKVETDTGRLLVLGLLAGAYIAFGGLLAVAVLPGMAGISGADYADPAAFDAGFHVAVTISAGLMVVAAIVAAAGIRRTREPITDDRFRIDECRHCAISGPPLNPSDARES